MTFLGSAAAVFGHRLHIPGADIQSTHCLLQVVGALGDIFQRRRLVLRVPGNLYHIIGYLMDAVGGLRRAGSEFLAGGGYLLGGGCDAVQDSRDGLLHVIGAGGNVGDLVLSGHDQRLTAQIAVGDTMHGVFYSCERL